MEPKFTITNGDKIEATLTMTLTIGDWEKFRRELNHVWPGSDLARAIDSLVVQSRRVFWSEGTP